MCITVILSDAELWSKFGCGSDGSGCIIVRDVSGVLRGARGETLADVLGRLAREMARGHKIGLEAGDLEMVSDILGDRTGKGLISNTAEINENNKQSLTLISLKQAAA